jgi:hypothetical protein
LPTKVLGNKTPHEVWTGRKPSLGHLKVFGCTAYSKIVKPHLKKLDDRSRKLVYFGVEEGSKAYMLYDPATNKIVVSRDAVFEEKLVWDWVKQSGSGNSVEFTVDGESATEVYGGGEYVEEQEWQEQVAQD